MLKYISGGEKGMIRQTNGLTIYRKRCGWGHGGIIHYI